MAVVKQTYTRPSTNVDWYYPPESEKNYINETYPNLVFGYETEGDLVFIKTRTGSLEECQLLYNDFNNMSSNIFTARRKYFTDNSISATFELIE
jgi:hypothetical protein